MQRVLGLHTQRLPLDTALLAHVALALLMWNIALRLGHLLVDGWMIMAL
jgi:hypothetical protein